MSDPTETAPPESLLPDDFFVAVFECVLDGIVIINAKGVICAVNAAIPIMFGYDREEMIGQNVRMLMHENTAAKHDGYLQNYAETSIAKIIGIGREDIARRANGEMFPIDLSVSQVDHGADRYYVGVIRDISDLKESQSIIEEQRRSLLDLSTPALQLFDGIVLMPLIGTIDSERASMVIERLLNTVSQFEAKVAILDVTGVNVIDTDVARHILKAVAAAKMLGSEVVLTGINPTGAQTLVQLGVDLSNVNTKGTLRSGIQEGLRLVGETID
ncbi:MAG: PAS domain S-box protein [Rhodospirillaceae bacterium]